MSENNNIVKTLELLRVFSSSVAIERCFEVLRTEDDGVAFNGEQHISWATPTDVQQG